MSLYELKKSWQNQCMRIYCFSFHVLAILALLSHFLSTTTRSIRYLPEFYERLMEDLVFLLVYIESFIFKLSLTSFQEIMSYMLAIFSCADGRIAFKCNAKAVSFFRLFIVFVTLALSGSIVETYVPISEEEKERLRYLSI